MFTKELAGLSDIIATTTGMTAIAVKNVVWTIFGIVFLIFVAFSLTLLYHWRRYGLKSPKVALAEIIYFLVSTAIIFVAFMALVFA